MKIAVYGDSFGDIVKYQKAKNYIGPHVSQSWPARLEEKYDVDNFSKTTTGLEWSYDLAISNDIEYDRIIFLASHVDRLMINSNWSKEAQQEHINQAAIGNGNRFFTKTILRAAQQYYAYFTNPKFSHNRAVLMYNDLKQRFGDRLLLLRIFLDGLGDEGKYNCDNEIYLSKLQEEEVKQYYGKNCNLSKRLAQGDKRTCHLTNPHHEMMFNKLDKWIQTKEFSLAQEDVITINKQELAKYFND